MVKIKNTSNFRSLTVTLATAFLGLLTVIIFISGGLNIYLNFRIQQKLIVNQQRLIAQEAANTVRNFIQERINMLRTTVVASKLLGAGQEEQKNILKKLLGLESAFRQFILLDPRNQPLAKASRLSDAASYGFIKLINPDIFSEAAEGRTYLSHIYIDNTTSEPMLVIAVPATGVFGDFKGILIAELNLKFMWDLVDKIKIGRSGLVYVVDREGYLIAFGDVSRVLRRENLKYLKEAVNFIEAKELSVEMKAGISKGIQNSYVVANHVPLGRPDWAVVVEIPFLEAYESVIQGIGVTVLIMLISIALAVITGTFLSKRITRPIITLRDAVVKIGKGELGTQIKIYTNDEIEDLAKAFNEMARDLKMTTTSIDNFNQQLAEREKAEENLKKAEQRYRTQFEEALDAIFVADTETGILIDCNAAATKLVGREKSEIIGQHQRVLHPPKEAGENFSRTFKQHLREKRGQSLEARVITKQGQIKHVEILANLLKIEDKMVLQGIFRDVTEHKKMQDELKNHVEQLEKFNKFVIGRELKMRELKIKIKKLEERLAFK